MSSRSHAPRTLAALACAAVSALAGCSSPPGGPHYTELGIVVASTSGAELADECIPLPVLPGGTIDEDLALAPSLSAHVFVVRDYAEVTLEGTNDPATSSVQVPEPTLLAGYQAELDVTTLDEKSYVVTLVSPCAPSPETPAQ